MTGSLNRFKLSWILSKSAFWISVIVPFFGTKGIGPDGVFFLLSLYYVFMVILEYPTGVIGDYFSHKLSITLGYFLSFVGMILPLFTLPMYLYYLNLFLLALGIALISGSDEALLYKLSKNFKVDLVNVTTYSMIFGLLTISLGGFFGSININIPVFMDAVFYLISTILMLTVVEPISAKYKVDAGNIFSFALKGVNYLLSNKKLLLLFSLNIPLSALLLSTKWLYNPIFELFHIPSFYWGILISGLSLISIIGSVFYKKIKFLSNKNIYFLSILFLVSLLSISLTKNIYIFGVSIIIMHFLNRFIDTYYVVEINNNLKDNIRASLVSLKSLIIRLTASLYLLLVGYTLNHFNISYLFLFTCLSIAIIWIVSSFVFKREKRLH